MSNTAIKNKKASLAGRLAFFSTVQLMKLIAHWVVFVELSR